MRILTVGILVLLACAPVSAADSVKRPNIILILTDDQGYGDLSCTGNPILKTPNLDALHDQSVRFTKFHVSPTCAPTRSAILTGRHEFHSGVTHTIFERERLSPKSGTFAEVLQTAGYTTGIFGKWHLGDEPAYQPEKRGFDEVFIHGGGGIGQTYPGSCGDAPGNRYFNPAISHNGKFVKTKGYCTDIFFDQAISWIGDRRKSGKPFYLHLATNAPHTPLDCPAEYEKKYADKVPAKVAKFFGMIANIDDNVGKLLKKLTEWDLDRDTIVVFMSDNGGTGGVQTYNAGMRGAKVTPYQGGTRVPLFIRWPGKAKPADVGKLTAHIDLYPTFVEIAGGKVPENAKLEGRSLVPLLTNPDAEWPDRFLFTHVGRWAKGKAKDSKYLNCSVQNTRFQMVSAAKGGAKKWELFDLVADPGQKTDVLEKFPGEAKKLEAAYDQWWESVLPDMVNEDAVGPKVNPFHERYWEQFPDERPKPKK